METTNIIVDEAKRFKEFRLAEGLTQGEIGEMLGRTTAHIQKFEDGTRRIQNKDVKKLHLKLEMSYEWFYHGKGHRKYKPEKTTLVKDLKTLETSLAIAESKIEQLDAAMKKIYKDFYIKSQS